MKTNDYYIKRGFSLFWGGPYSQWTIAPFTWNDIEFNCNEQFMMFFKALVHKDIETARLVLEEKDPKEHKKLGRSIKNFDPKLWDYTTSIAVVYVANYLKFQSNDDLWSYLDNDKGQVIVEASPVDRIWGIGLSCDNPLAWSEDTWEGENRLGTCITKVREIFRHPDDEDQQTWKEFAFAAVDIIFKESGFSKLI